MKFFEIETKEDLFNFTYLDIAYSLMSNNKFDEDASLLMSWFVSHKEKPNIKQLQKSFLENYACNKFETLIIIPEEIAKELKTIMDCNKLSKFTSNYSLI